MIKVVSLTIGLARDFALETRVRRLVDDHLAAGDEPRTLVMNAQTWRDLVTELEGRRFDSGYFWIPGKQAGLAGEADPEGNVTFFRGVPILIKDFVAYGEVLVGV